MTALLGVLVAFLSLIAQSPPAIPYFIQDGKGLPGYDSGDPELARFALDAWSRESGGRLHFVPVSAESSALIRIQWVAADAGRFGETRQIQVNGKQGAVVYIALPASLGPPLSNMIKEDSLLRDTIVYLTCVHEIGHAVGMPHTKNFADIMYSFSYGGDIVQYFNRYRRELQSRGDIRRLSGLSPGDVQTLQGLR